MFFRKMSEIDCCTAFAFQSTYKAQNCHDLICSFCVKTIWYDLSAAASSLEKLQLVMCLIL